MSLQEWILQALFESNGITNEAQKVIYLQSLKPIVKRFRTSYNASQSTNVRAKYTDKKEQEAYFLVYFANYTKSIIHILTSLSTLEIFQPFYQELNANFYGAGPCPEVFGFVDFACSNLKFSALRVNTFDKNALTWSYSRKIVEESLFPHICNFPVNFSSNFIDLGNLNWQESEQVNQSATLFMFQNCLNEIPHDQAQILINSVERLIHFMPNNSLLIFSDIVNYNKSMEMIKQIESTNDQSIQVIRSIDNGETRIVSSHRNLPQIVRENLLTGEDGLIPKTSPYRFNYSVMRKRAF